MVANASGENFPVALRVLPEAHRRHLTALYCFARLTDDLGDEARVRGAWGDGQSLHERGDPGGRPPGPAQAMRLKLLDELEADVRRIYDGHAPESPALKTLADTVRECGVPAQPLLDLIQANRQDQQVTRYATLAELQQYCDLSANPVGRVVLYIFGAATGERIALSDRICTALQLAEHWQDVAEDLRDKGRIYLPADEMERFGVTEADLAEPTANLAVRTLMTFEVARARHMLDDGAPLVGTLHGWARLAVAGYVAGGRAALAAIEAQNYDVLAATARPRKRRLAGELVKTYLSRR